MGAEWQVVAFPVILPWREEFWTLPLYFPDLKVGVLPGWPTGLPYQGMPLPPEASAPGRDLRHYQPGDLRAWHAFAEYRQGKEEVADIIQALKGQAPEPSPEREPSADVWSLAWQLEKMQADEEAQLLRVDKGQAWLTEILAPEPWEEPAQFGPVPGPKEMVDPDLALMRYRLWRRVMAPHLREPWAPLLLGRTSRAIFLALKGWPQWILLKRVQVLLPGCRSEKEMSEAWQTAGKRKWQEKFQQLLAPALEAAVAGSQQDLAAAAREMNQFVEEKMIRKWPLSSTWRWDLEIWAQDSEEVEELGPVLCWAGAGAGILPG
jgi:hypothetical protein